VTKGPFTWLLCLIVGLSESPAQYWTPLRNGLPNNTGGARVVVGDSTRDRLLVGSPTKWIIEGNDTLTIVGISQWDGARWDTLPGRVQSDQGSTQNGCSPVNNLIRYRGKLYANGSFRFLTDDGVWNDAIAKWDDTEQKWKELECLNPTIGGMYSMFHVPPNDTMYFTGYTGSVCGYPESCVFAYDGSAFYPFAPFGDWVGIPGSEYVGFVFRFQGTLYMTGLFDNPITGDFHGFLRYTGSNWETVPGFTTPAPIKDVLIHDDKLYMCGYFFTNTGAPGNMVTVFDGETWSDMSGGLRYSMPDGTLGNCYDLHEWNDDIYVGGQFYYAGGVPAENVARWDGHQWCGMGGTYATETPIGHVNGIGDWRDTLYIAGAFTTIDGDTMNKVAKWLGVVENCSPAVSVPEQRVASQPIIPVLLDPEGVWQFSVPDGVTEFTVHDAMGRLVLEQNLPPGTTRQTVDLRNSNSGVYMLRCVGSMGLQGCSKLQRP